MFKTSRCTVLGFFCALGLAVGCGERNQGVSGGGPPPPMVEVVEIAPRSISEVAEIYGQLAAEMSVEVRSEIEGIVEEFLFEEGQHVSRGDVLFRLRSQEQRAGLREAKALLGLAETVYARTEILAQRDVSSHAQLDSAEAELEVTRARVERSRVELDRTVIRAPFDGEVGARNVDTGDRIQEAQILVEIAALDRLQLLFTLPEVAVGRVEPGIAVKIRVAPFPDEVFHGVIYFVSPSLNPRVRRIPVKAWVPNPGHRLRPGLFAEIEAEFARRDDALFVPESSLVYDLEGIFVWRVGESKRAERVSIELGLRRDGEVEVITGLSAGDIVVSSGVHKVTDGFPVQTLKLSRGRTGKTVGGGFDS